MDLVLNGVRVLNSILGSKRLHTLSGNLVGRALAGGNGNMGSVVKLT